MFMMFAMTTDSVGVIIPEVIRQFKLSMTAASAFHYVTMASLGLAGIFCGHMADKLGHKRTIIVGLSLFAANSVLFVFGHAFGFFLALLMISGVSIGIFKTGALALIGDISGSTREHTSMMNAVEGFFGAGAIVGPAIVARLLAGGVSWQWLYAIAGALSVALVVTASRISYPGSHKAHEQKVGFAQTLRMVVDPYAAGFSVALFLYVAVECAIYVWMPTFLQSYRGGWGQIAHYALAIFFVLRAGGRFLGSWLLAKCEWTLVMMLFSTAILLCFAGSLWGGISAAVFLLPLSGLFMSVIYPTLNSKGISCFPKSHHGAVSGVILFFSCAAAALGPLAMGAVSDAAGNARAGFVLATGFAALLSAGLVLNWILKPARSRLQSRDATEYEHAAEA